MEKKSNNGHGRRVILFPLPLQGCINPMIKLAKILHSRGFSITVIHTHFNAPKASNHPLFTFFEIQDGLSERDTKPQDITMMLMLLNQRCASPFREYLTKLLYSKERISCLIVDFGWFFTLPISKSLNIPSLTLVAPNVSFFRFHFALPRLRQRYLALQDSEQDDPVKEFPPLRKKDVTHFLNEEPEIIDVYLNNMYEATKESSGLIFLSCEELFDQYSLTQTRQDFKMPIYAIGPSHAEFPASSSSLLTPDETCIPWLDQQEDKSVVYVSFGSLAILTETELLEIAWGLRNSGKPFLFVVRVGSLSSTQWIETLPEELRERLNEKGKIVKWAPQHDVLKHRAIGVYLTHNGWNSTIESICEGVPMICLPFIWDQMVNARFVSEIWMVGLHLENGIVRDEIERAIRRLLMEDEGEAIRERMNLLKERVERSVKENGLAYQALNNLIDHILSF